MKKFLALLFVCAGLTAMAAPHVNKTDFVQAKKGEMLMKSNNMAQHFTTAATQSFMAGAKKSLEAQRVNPENLVNQRAPRRLTADEMINNDYVCFLYKCKYKEDGTGYEEADPFYAGMGAYWYPGETDPVYFAGLYWFDGSTYYLPLEIDFTTGEVALPWGMLLDDDTTSTSSTGTGRFRTDTVTFTILCSEAYYLNNEQTDCKGTLYQDGSIIFDDNYVFYGYQAIIQYGQSATVPVSKDTTWFEEVYVGTEILAANGELTYTREQTGAADKDPVYMYQEGDMLYVGNLWGYGMPSTEFQITSDGRAIYNCVAEVVDSITYLDNGIWDVDDTWISGGLGMFYGVGDYTVDSEGYIDDYTWGFEGVATPQQITWDYTMPCNGYHFLYGYLNNVLKWTNGNTFVIPAAAGLRGDVNDDGSVTIADVTALIDALLGQNFDDVPGVFSGDNADCNKDGSISIADVTALIDYLLSKEWPAE